MCSYWATVGQCSAIWWERALFWCSSMKRGYDEEHEAMWQGPAKCMKVGPFFFFFLFEKKKMSSFPDLNTENTKVTHADLFANVASNCQISWTHFLSFRSFRGGRHQLPTLALSLRFPLFFVRLIKIYPFPPQITSSAPSRSQPAAGRWKSEGAESSRLSALSGRCESWDKRTVSIHFLFSPLFFFFWFVVFFLSDQCNDLTEPLMRECLIAKVIMYI